VAFRPDGRTLASASEETIKLWDVVTGKERTHFHGHRSDINTVAFRSDGKVLASGGEDGEIKLWDFPAARRPDK
jgi:WD40 repeat protein